MGILVEEKEILTFKLRREDPEVNNLIFILFLFFSLFHFRRECLSRKVNTFFFSRLQCFYLIFYLAVIINSILQYTFSTFDIGDSPFRFRAWVPTRKMTFALSLDFVVTFRCR